MRSAGRFRLRVYRLGWYGGAGAALLYDKTGFGKRNASDRDRCGALSSDRDIRRREREHGLVECPLAAARAPETWHTPVGDLPCAGVFCIGGASRDTLATFVVRDDSSRARLIIVNPTTMAAYNRWADCRLICSSRSMYPYFGPRATKVAMARPTARLSTHFKTDYPLVRFLEREALPYSVATDVDVAMRARLLRRIVGR